MSTTRFEGNSRENVICREKLTLQSFSWEGSSSNQENAVCVSVSTKTFERYSAQLSRGCPRYFILQWTPDCQFLLVTLGASSRNAQTAETDTCRYVITLPLFLGKEVICHSFSVKISVFCCSERYVS